MTFHELAILWQILWQLYVPVKYVSKYVRGRIGDGDEQAELVLPDSGFGFGFDKIHRQKLRNLL